MNCRFVSRCLVELFDVDPDRSLRAGLLRHLETCPRCSQEYNDFKKTVEAVQPSYHVVASSDFKGCVMNKISEMTSGDMGLETQGAYRRRRGTVGLALATAAAVLVTVTFGMRRVGRPGQEAPLAFTVLGEAAHAMVNLRSVHIEARMRTLPRDNFELIGLDYDFVPIEMWKQFTVPPRWRVEKPGRVAAMDGESALLWIKPRYAAKGPMGAGFVGWLKPLMDVDHVLDSELRLAQEQGSTLALEYEDDLDGASQLVVRVEAVAQGDYTNDWLLNKSITDSNNLRVYRLDAETKRLEGLEVWVHADDGDVLAFEITHIDYDADLPPTLFALELPEHVIWFEEPTVSSAEDLRHVNTTPEEFARAFFQACGDEKWEEVRELWGLSEVPQGVKEHLSGLEILSIGQAFKSGLYPGWFVPYEIKFRSGGTKKMNLAVRNDNPARRFQVDGGF